jgi:predicted nucleotidyltransferase
MTGRSQLAETCALLNERGARYVLVGGFAVQLWGSARVTKDIDILIEPTVENAQRVLDAIAQLTGSWGLARDLLAEEVARKPVTIIGDIPRIDVLTVAHTLHYADAAPDAIDFEVDGVRIPTASIEHLIASKQTGRLRDAAVVEELLDIRRERGGR